MKYALIYFNTSRYLKDFDEVVLKYDHKTINIIEYVQTKCEQEQRIVLNVQFLSDEDFEESLEYFAAAAQVHPNIALMGNVQQLDLMKKSGLSFFFGNVVSTWDTLNGYINMGVSDVYIGNEFAFYMKAISRVCKEHNVQVRVFANVAQTDCPAVGNTMTQFFIRPEDVTLYEELVDVIEFYGPIDRQDVLYEIYTKGKWIGNLSELIIGLKENVNNTLIAGCFGTLRRNCGKRCGYTSSCNICTRFVSIQKTLEEVNSEH